MGKALNEVVSEYHLEAAGKRGIAKEFEEITRFHEMRLWINGMDANTEKSRIKGSKAFL